MNLYKNYPDYLKSEHWTFTRNKIMERAKYQCEVCEKQKADEVHHINYRNWIDVINDDLIAVCECCHTKIHNAIKRGFINQDNKCSKEKTMIGLVNYLNNPNKVINSKSRTTYTVTKKMCELMNKASPKQKQLLCGIFKTFPPTNWIIFLGKSINKKMNFNIWRILNYKKPNLGKRLPPNEAKRLFRPPINTV